MMAAPAVNRFTGGDLSLEDLWIRHLRNIGHWAADGYGLFTAERHDGRFVGMLGYADFRRMLGPDFDGVPEAAWILAADAHGQGLATEGVAATLAWIEQTRAPARTTCLIHPDNAASLRVAAKLGYGTFRQVAEYRGGPALLLARDHLPNRA
jgi:RimJ/RimL family protein N-acetyltransferase